MFLKTALDALSFINVSAVALLMKLAGLPVSTVKDKIELKERTKTSMLFGLSLRSWISIILATSESGEVWELSGGVSSLSEIISEGRFFSSFSIDSTVISSLSLLDPSSTCVSTKAA